MTWFWQITYRLLVFFLWLASLPLQVGLGLLIVTSSGLPILYRQKRIGLAGRPFVLYKFRTMKLGAAKLRGKLQKYNEADGPVFKIRDDPRFTQVGGFLSHTGLDELPQLVNVIRGEMALIGPRPLPLAEAKKLKAWQRERERVLPGIISPWILDGYHTRSFDDWMRSDLAYARQKSLALDLVLTVRTIRFLTKLVLSESLTGMVQ